MRQENVIIAKARFSRVDTSVEIIVLLLREGDMWHVATRRAFVTAEGEIDEGGADTYLAEESTTNMREPVARAVFASVLVTVVSKTNWMDFQ